MHKCCCTYFIFCRYFSNHKKWKC